MDLFLLVCRFLQILPGCGFHRHGPMTCYHVRVALVTNPCPLQAYVLYSFDSVFVWSGRDWRGVHLYTVGAIYLLMTIVVEMPVVYGCLKKSAKDRKYLIGAIVGSNVVTTLITAAAERILCWGKW